MDSNAQQQLALALFEEIPEIDLLISKREDQWFDRKSFRIDRRKLAECLIGMANADGGRVAIGISNGQIEGVDSNVEHLNELMQTARDFAEPPVRSTNRLLDCVNSKAAADRLLVIDVEASETIHRTPKGQCFLRVGDETRELLRDEERELAFDKGEAVFDCSLAPNVELQDLDLNGIDSYAQLLNTSRERVMRSRGLSLVRDSQPYVTQAGWLLFGLTPPIWSFVRYLRYNGTTIETGVRSNISKDVRLEGPIPELIEQAQALLKDEVGEVIRLQKDGRFATVPALPEFAWLEAVVNALTHRSYSAQGNGIYIRHFSDRLEVENPGRLPGLVRARNIRNMRFARNPHVARVLAEMTFYVRELNEGVPRMIQEMVQSGLPEPSFEPGDASFRVVLYKQPAENQVRPSDDVTELLDRLRVTLGRKGSARMMDLLEVFTSDEAREEGLATIGIVKQLGISRNTIARYLRLLEESGLLRREAQSVNDPNARWKPSPSPLWTFVRDTSSRS